MTFFRLIGVQTPSPNGVDCKNALPSATLPNAPQTRIAPSPMAQSSAQSTPSDLGNFRSSQSEPTSVSYFSHSNLSKSRVTVTSRLAPWLATLVYPLGYHVVLPLYFRSIQVLGREHLPKTGPVILAPTHRSRWDALMIPYAAGKLVTGRHPRFMVTADEIKGIQGWFIRRLGGFPIDTHRPGIGSLRHGIELLEQGEMLTIFPEGNIFRDGKLQTLKSGLARLALQAEANQPGLEVKVVPIHLHYSQPSVPWRTAVEIEIGQPLTVSHYKTGHSKQDAKALTNDLTQALQDLTDRFAQRTLA